MAPPPKAYPNEWRQGAAVYGRNYGAGRGINANRGVQPLVASVSLRDPRYYPSPNHAVAARIVHATWCALGELLGLRSLPPGFRQPHRRHRRRLCRRRFYLPGDYTDLGHAGERTGVQMAAFAAGNMFDEFGPELNKLTRAVTSRFRWKD